ncbi:galanin receptor type 1 [Hydra vulgaris]|uniref:galanin receptor type 1 n=1 Tax=Hydra vulgaris TaxID=6087 RepID=UPI001F5F6A4D|nr:galanin receptor type 1-like [Hydra vulgaris]
MSKFPFRYWEFFWYLCVAIIGGVGNFIVLFVIIKSKKLKSSSPFNILIFALALTDLMASLIGLPNYILSTDAFEHPTGANGDLLCKLFTGYFWTFWLLELSVILLVLISLERRAVVLNPFLTFYETSFKKTVALIIGSIFFTFLISTPNIVGVVYDKNNARGGNFCRYKYTYYESLGIYGAIFLLDTIIPSGIILRCFYDIKNTLKKSDISITPKITSYESLKTSEKKNNPKIKTAETLQLVVLAFFVCIIPNQILYVMSFAKVKEITWNSQIYQIAVLLRFSNSCINPILYSFHSVNFRQNARIAFNSWMKRNQQINFYTRESFITKYRSQSINSNVDSIESNPII